MRVKTASPADIYNVALNMRDEDFRELSAISWHDERDQLAEEITGKLTQPGMLRMSFGTDKAIAIVAAIELWPRVWSLGFFATDEWRVIGKSLTKFAVDNIIPELERAKPCRVEVRSIEGHKEAHQWIRYLGMKREDRLLNYGKNGEDFICFYWLEGDPIKKGLNDVFTVST